MKRYILLFIALLTLIYLGIEALSNSEQKQYVPSKNGLSNVPVSTNPIKNKSREPIPPEKTLQGITHIYQTFNNCGPASLSMALSFFNINKSQHELGNELRPYQNPIGDNDDKSVTLSELAEKSKEFGFIPYHRPAGSIELLQKFIANDIPVITRTWLSATEDIGHYRVVKGYNLQNQTIIQDDSLQGKNIEYSYQEFNTIWKKFNYEYLVLVPTEKNELAKTILGENFDSTIAWENAVELSKADLNNYPNDAQARFNLSVAYYNVGNYNESIKEFELVENQISKRSLWYQIEPILAYYQVKNYSKVFEVTDYILNNHNLAFSELYVIRGKIYLEENNKEAAIKEFEQALFYNKNLKEAQELVQLYSQ